ncbi:MAG: putative rane protein of unknown function [Microbacteriaceae bacterium]|nr:putative rane protein of unknown function [Microbacteriaceae bacterium]
MSTLVQRILPVGQRRTLEELTDRLDLGSGESTAKRSAFWTMLVLAAIIAIAGVIADSTATVIGAMIIAPLSTPIMGVALGIVKASGSAIGRSLLYIAGGLLVVVALGWLFSLFLPDPGSLLSNSQVLGRTSPQLLDLLVALATGFAGAFALCRRDFNSILPGVAIAVSLVPPLGVVGVCAGRGDFDLALGALVLFLSNLVALVIAGSIVFTLYGYTREVAALTVDRGRAYLAVAGILAIVLIPLAANTVTSVLIAGWTTRISDAANEWILDVPHSQIDGVSWHGLQAVIEIRSPTADLHTVEALQALLRGKIPDTVHVTVDLTLGRVIPVE